MIASHYAEPLDGSIAKGTVLRSAPNEQADLIRQLEPGEPFAMLDESMGWAWGYAGEDRRVGYVVSASLAQ